MSLSPTDDLGEKNVKVIIKKNGRQKLFTQSHARSNSEPVGASKGILEALEFVKVKPEKNRQDNEKHSPDARQDTEMSTENSDAASLTVSSPDAQLTAAVTAVTAGAAASVMNTDSSAVHIPLRSLNDCSVVCSQVFFSLYDGRSKADLCPNISTSAYRRHIAALGFIDGKFFKAVDVDIILKKISYPQISLPTYCFGLVLSTAKRFRTLSHVALLSRLTQILQSYLKQNSHVNSGQEIRAAAGVLELSEGDTQLVEEIVQQQYKVLQSIYNCYLQSGPRSELLYKGGEAMLHSPGYGDAASSRHAAYGASFSIQSFTQFAKDFNICPDIITLSEIQELFRRGVSDQTNSGSKFASAQPQDLLSPDIIPSVSLQEFIQLLIKISLMCDWSYDSGLLPYPKIRILPENSESLVDEAPESKPLQSFRNLLILMEASEGKEKLILRERSSTMLHGFRLHDQPRPKVCTPSASAHQKQTKENFAFITRNKNPF